MKTKSGGKPTFLTTSFFELKSYRLIERHSTRKWLRVPNISQVGKVGLPPLFRLCWCLFGDTTRHNLTIRPRASSPPFGVMFMRLAILTFFALVLWAVSVAQEGGRIMPPPQLKCDRNDLTSYDGRILAYRRRLGSTFLRIRTNFDTTEEVTIRHRGSDDPSKFYLINGEAFTKTDWRRIEKRPRVLKVDAR